MEARRWQSAPSKHSVLRVMRAIGSPKLLARAADGEVGWRAGEKEHRLNSVPCAISPAGATK